MARGSGRDKRETFVLDTVRLRNKTSGPQAPHSNTLELYFKNEILYKETPDGVETPIGGFGASASPGFTWGRLGPLTLSYTAAANSEEGHYLFNDQVPSNVTGRTIVFERPILRKVTVSNSTASTFRVMVQEHDGLGNFYDLAEVSLVTAYAASVDFNIEVTNGRQLAVKVMEGSCNNPVVGVILDGLL